MIRSPADIFVSILSLYLSLVDRKTAACEIGSKKTRGENREKDTEENASTRNPADLVAVVKTVWQRAARNFTKIIINNVVRACRYCCVLLTMAVDVVTLRDT